MHNCLNCGNQVADKYCGICGEKVYTEKDKSLFHFFGDALHFLTHFEGTFLTSLKSMFTKPGLMSLEYCYGLRKKYFKPLSLFLLIIILYLFFPLSNGLNLSLDYHTHSLYHDFASKKVLAMMKQNSLNYEQVADLFSQESKVVSKFFLIILIPAGALFFWLFFHKKRNFFFDHLIFSTEISSFYILAGNILIPFIFLTINGFKPNSGNQFIFTVVISAVYLFYTTIASRRFYQLKFFPSISISFLFLIFYSLFVTLIYRFLLFLITIYLL